MQFTMATGATPQKNCWIQIYVPQKWGLPKKEEKYRHFTGILCMHALRCIIIYWGGRVENRFCIAHIRVGRYSRGGGGWGGGCRSRPDLNIFPLPGTSQSMYILLGRFSHISIFRNHRNRFFKSFQYLVYVVVQLLVNGKIAYSAISDALLLD